MKYKFYQEGWGQVELNEFSNLTTNLDTYILKDVMDFELITTEELKELLLLLQELKKFR